VAIFARKEHAMKAYQPREWTPRLIMGRIGDLVVISVYASERFKETTTVEVKWRIRECEAQGLTVIVAGDFNVQEGKMKDLARGWNAHVADSPPGGTREGRDNKMSTLDYYVSNRALPAATTVGDLSTSDHRLMTITIARETNVTKPT
jgi:hypothetical protein